MPQNWLNGKEISASSLIMNMLFIPVYEDNTHALVPNGLGGSDTVEAAWVTIKDFHSTTGAYTWRSSGVQKTKTSF